MEANSILETLGQETGLMEDTNELEAPPTETALFGEKEEEMEWFITPEQFVDFWISAIFLLVGTWEIITILFLLTE